MAKSLYDCDGIQTDDSRKFCDEVEDAVEPIFEKYLGMGFSVRDLSHEANVRLEI